MVCICGLMNASGSCNKGNLIPKIFDHMLVTEAEPLQNYPVALNNRLVKSLSNQLPFFPLGHN